ncbi:hypothetical protein DL89DRAFT_62935 [Linderina pennispora]|uniref:Uncharacterized protein n=1 Tax=Linderina pennispora TaxID=61395 RepID=A0A1Y1VRG1_9FUNG|nr:uncharacterized protein DL89DRAFT_62935 [Linderina pennispora]ORX63882.1 hypothetical protein DL89DRAFT_62935 [Linderina pennispora]
MAQAAGGGRAGGVDGSNARLGWRRYPGTVYRGCAARSAQAVPTLYESAQRLQISADVINVSMTDLRLAAAQIVPSSQRSATSSAMPLPQPLQPLLGQLVGIAALKLSTALALGSSAPNVFRPRLAVHGAAGMASASVGAAAAYAMEARDVPVFHVTPALLHDIAGVGHLFQEALRRQPSVLHVPMADGLALTMDAAAIAMLDHCIRALPIGARVAVLCGCRSR